MNARQQHAALVSDLCWSDPKDDEADGDPATRLDEHGFGPNRRGRGVLCFGEKAVDDFCANHGFEYIFRAHQEKTYGLRIAKSSRVITVFSSSDYEKKGNGAGLLYVNGEGEVLLIIKRAARRPPAAPPPPPPAPPPRRPAAVLLGHAQPFLAAAAAPALYAAAAPPAAWCGAAALLLVIPPLLLLLRAGAGREAGWLLAACAVGAAACAAVAAPAATAAGGGRGGAQAPPLPLDAGWWAWPEPLPTAAVAGALSAAPFAWAAGFAAASHAPAAGGSGGAR